MRDAAEETAPVFGHTSPEFFADRTREAAAAEAETAAAVSGPELGTVTAAAA